MRLAVDSDFYLEQETQLIDHTHVNIHFAKFLPKCTAYHYI